MIEQHVKPKELGILSVNRKILSAPVLFYNLMNVLSESENTYHSILK